LNFSGSASNINRATSIEQYQSSNINQATSIKQYPSRTISNEANVAERS